MLDNAFLIDYLSAKHQPKLKGRIMKIETVPVEVISTENCQATSDPRVFTDPSSGIIVVGQDEAVKITT